MGLIDFFINRIWADAFGLKGVFRDIFFSEHPIDGEKKSPEEILLDTVLADTAGLKGDDRDFFFATGARPSKAAPDQSVKRNAEHAQRRNVSRSVEEVRGGTLKQQAYDRARHTNFFATVSAADMERIIREARNKNKPPETEEKGLSEEERKKRLTYSPAIQNRLEAQEYNRQHPGPIYGFEEMYEKPAVSDKQYMDALQRRICELSEDARAGESETAAGDELRYAIVRFPSLSGHYPYLCPDLSVQEGDCVIVPIGKKDILTEAAVIGIIMCSNTSIPWPADVIKTVIGKKQPQEQSEPQTV